MLVDNGMRLPYLTIEPDHHTAHGVIALHLLSVTSVEGRQRRLEVRDKH